MNRETLDQWCERGILALVLAILVCTTLLFGGRPQPAVGSVFDFLANNPFLLTQSLAIGVLVLWLFRIWLNPSQRFLWPPICWAVLAFAVYAIVRYTQADIEYVARQELLQVLVYSFLFLAVLNHLHRQESTQIIAVTLVFLAMALSFVAVYQFLTGSDRVWYLHKPYPRRGSGTFISPNHLGGFLEMILPMGLAFTLVSRSKPLTKVFLGYASLAILTGIAVTMSRGSWISTGFALVLLFGLLLFQPGYRLASLALVVVLIGSGIYFIPRNDFLQGRLRQLMSQGQAGAEGRTPLWPPSLRLWQENVWWGVGPAHFDYRFRMYRPESLQLRPDRPHNDFLNTLVDWGVVGAALVASTLALLVVGVLKTWRFVRGTPRDLGEKKSSNKFAFVLGACVGLVAILIHSCADFNMHIPANALVAVTLMALLTSHLRFATERYWLSARLWIRLLASVGLLVGIVYLGQQCGRHAAESRWLIRAARAPNFSPAKAALLEKAFAAEPMNFETAFAIGECYRTQSQDGGPNYRELARRAMDWYERCTKLNRWDGYGYLKYGLCLDWLDRPLESAPYFDRAEQLDPNGYFTVANIGRHYVNLGDYAAARPWFERSLLLYSGENDVARNYLQIVEQTLMEAATNEIRAKLSLSPPTPAPNP